MVLKELEKINKIAFGKIPVSEESPIHPLFLMRKKVALEIRNNNYNGASLSLAFTVLEHTETNIKEYLCL